MCGAKAVGKSTWCRALVNTLLSGPGDSVHGASSRSPVLFLDLDIGQPELGPPGMLALYHVTEPLLGPAHTHLRRPLLWVPAPAARSPLPSPSPLPPDPPPPLPPPARRP